MVDYSGLENRRTETYRGFESLSLRKEKRVIRKAFLYLFLSFGALVQSVRIPACHAGGHGFESRTHRQTTTSRSGAVVARQAHNLEVSGSIPLSATLFFHANTRKIFNFAKIAQLVEHDLAKVGVAGSSPVFRSTSFATTRGGGEIGRHATLRG